MNSLSENTLTNNKPIKIGLLGTSLDTGNMGVNALIISSIKCILHRWPNAEITLLDSGRTVKEEQLRIGDNDIPIKIMPIRFCKNIFLKNHFFVLCFYAFILKMFHGKNSVHFCTRRNPNLDTILQLNMVADITGGDSFSDIYGMRRFILGFLRKFLILLFGKDLIMLPQTYGPFQKRLTKIMARYVIKRARLVYSRDHTGVEYINALLGNNDNGKARFSPDVAFILDARKPENIDIKPSADIRTQNSILIGLNISGLLFNGGYNRNNMFGLKCVYSELIVAVIENLLQDKNVSIILIPHVFPPTDNTIESDPDACLKIYEKIKQTYNSRISLATGTYDQSEIKYIIGLCDFFIGSRMHSCIAAISQCIPAAGLAYSGKFQGVFDSVNLGECVADMRTLKSDEILEKLKSIFQNRVKTRCQLEQTVPKIKYDIMHLIRDLDVS